MLAKDVAYLTGLMARLQPFHGRSLLPVYRTVANDVEALGDVLQNLRPSHINIVAFMGNTT